jgi:hypothetical protein
MLSDPKGMVCHQSEVSAVELEQIEKLGHLASVKDYHFEYFNRNSASFLGSVTITS